MSEMGYLLIKWSYGTFLYIPVQFWTNLYKSVQIGIQVIQEITMVQNILIYVTVNQDGNGLYL